MRRGHSYGQRRMARLHAAINWLMLATIVIGSVALALILSAMI